MNESLVCIVDDDPSVRKGIARLLSANGYRTETFSDAAEFLAHLPSGTPACVVLDLTMPGMSGLDLQKQLRERAPGLAIVFVTGHGDIPASVAAMKYGAVDFLLKPFDETQLLSAVASAIERARVQFDDDFEQTELKSRWESLTSREREVFQGVVGGALNKQVAFEAGISEKTVKIHRAHVMEKMGAPSFAVLVRMAAKLGKGTSDMLANNSPDDND